MASSPLLGELTRFLAEPDLSKILLSWSLLQNDRSEWFGITFTVILQISNMDYFLERRRYVVKTDPIRLAIREQCKRKTIF